MTLSRSGGGGGNRDNKDGQMWIATIRQQQ
jgi:hypothetical protein